MLLYVPCSDLFLLTKFCYFAKTFWRKTWNLLFTLLFVKLKSWLINSTWWERKNKRKRNQFMHVACMNIEIVLLFHISIFLKKFYAYWFESMNVSTLQAKPIQVLTSIFSNPETMRVSSHITFHCFNVKLPVSSSYIEKWSPLWLHNKIDGKNTLLHS